MYKNSYSTRMVEVEEEEEEERSKATLAEETCQHPTGEAAHKR